MQEPKILITGATGNVGTELTKILIERKVLFRVMVRGTADAEKFSNVENVEIIVADFDKPETVEKALKNIERAFLLTPSSENAEKQQKDFVQAALNGGVKHIVKQSQWAASNDSPVRFLRYHRSVEEEIEQSSLNFTFLRPNLFMQNLLGFKDFIKAEGKFYGDADDCRISIVDVRDIAAVAAAALTENGHENKIYSVTGPEALTHSEMAGKFSAALDKEVEYINVAPDEMCKMYIKFGFPEWQATGLKEDFAHYRRGEASEIVADAEKATGNKTFNFDEFVRDYINVFQ